MAEGRQRTFIEKWIKRAREATDPFDKFFSLWIALIVAAQRIRLRTGMGFREDDTDRQRILDYFGSNIPKIKEILEDKKVTMIKFAKRRGSKHRNPIVDTGNRELKEKFARLSNHYKEEISISDQELINSVGELFNKIRNNLFHGVKIFDDKEDIDLINLVNPILLEILEKCESY